MQTSSRRYYKCKFAESVTVSTANTSNTDTSDPDIYGPGPVQVKPDTGPIQVKPTQPEGVVDGVVRPAVEPAVEPAVAIIDPVHITRAPIRADLRRSLMHVYEEDGWCGPRGSPGYWHLDGGSGSAAHSPNPCSVAVGKRDVGRSSKEGRPESKEEDGEEISRLELKG
jgi:hypothetical protein